MKRLLHIGRTRFLASANKRACLHSAYRKRSWLITIIVCLLILGGGGAVLLLPQVVPFDQCSDVYKRYAKMDGVDATFIKDYKVDDSVVVSATLLETEDTCMWEELCEDMHIPSITKIPEEFKDLFLSKNTFGYIVEKDSSLIAEKGMCFRNLYVYSRKDMTICVFHSLTEEQYDAIIDKEIDDISF